MSTGRDTIRAARDEDHQRNSERCTTGDRRTEPSWTLTGSALERRTVAKRGRGLGAGSGI
jgi:hypothetical protein